MRISGPLHLSVKTKAWRMEGQWESSQSSWSKTRLEILERDSNTCCYCGFSAPKYQEVHHLDDDHDNNHPDNLVTTCPLCHACHHIGLAGMQNKGTLLYLPEISQQDLHWMVRWISLSVYSDDMGGYLDAPRKMVADFIIHRKKLCEARIGTSSPVKLANSLLDRGESSFEETANKATYPLRMIPALVTDNEVDYLHGYEENVKSIWSEQMKILVPDMTQIMDYIGAGTISK